MGWKHLTVTLPAANDSGSGFSDDDTIWLLSPDQWLLSPHQPQPRPLWQQVEFLMQCIEAELGLWYPPGHPPATSFHALQPSEQMSLLVLVGLRPPQWEHMLWQVPQGFWQETLQLVYSYSGNSLYQQQQQQAVMTPAAAAAPRYDELPAKEQQALSEIRGRWLPTLDWFQRRRQHIYWQNLWCQLEYYKFVLGVPGAACPVGPAPPPFHLLSKQDQMAVLQLLRIEQVPLMVQQLRSMLLHFIQQQMPPLLLQLLQQQAQPVLLDAMQQHMLPMLPMLLQQQQLPPEQAQLLQQQLPSMLVQVLQQHAWQEMPPSAGLLQLLQEQRGMWRDALWLVQHYSMDPDQSEAEAAAAAVQNAPELEDLPVMEWEALMAIINWRGYANDVSIAVA